MKWSMRTSRPDGMSENAMATLEKNMDEGGWERLGKKETPNGTVFVARRPKVTSGIVHPNTVEVFWACRDFAQVNEMNITDNSTIQAVCLKAAEDFFGSKDF